MDLTLRVMMEELISIGADDDDDNVAPSTLNTMAPSSSYIDVKNNVFLALKKHNIPNELIHMIFGRIRFTTTQYIDACLPTRENHALDKPKGSIFTDCFNTPTKLLDLNLVTIVHAMKDIQTDPKNRRRPLLLRKLIHIATILHDSILPYMDPRFNQPNYKKLDFVEFVKKAINAKLLLIKDPKVRGINNPENILTLWLKYDFNEYLDYMNDKIRFFGFFDAHNINIDQSCLEYTTNFALDNNYHLYIKYILQMRNVCADPNVHIWNCTLSTIKRLFTFPSTLRPSYKKTYHGIIFEHIGDSAYFINGDFRPDVIDLLFKLVRHKDVHFVSAVLVCCCIFASPNSIPEHDLVDAVNYIIRYRLPSIDHVAVFYRIMKNILASSIYHHATDNPDVYLTLFDPQLENHSAEKPYEWSEFILD